MLHYIDDFKYAINEIFPKFERSRYFWHPVKEDELKSTGKSFYIFNLLEINNVEKVEDKQYKADIKVYLEMDAENAFNSALRIPAFFDSPAISKELKDNNIEVIQVSKMKNLSKSDDINKQGDKDWDSKDEETRKVGLEIEFRYFFNI